MYDLEQELKDIADYQRTQDPMLLQKLRRQFNGTIMSAIRESKTNNLDSRGLYQKAMVKLPSALLQYNVTDFKSKPSTYITTHIKGHLGNENTRLRSLVRPANEITTLQHQIGIQKELAELEGRDSSNEAIVDRLNDSRASAKRITVDAIKSALLTNRKIMSGDKTTSGETGEAISRMDAMNATNMSADEAHNANQRNDIAEQFKKKLISEGRQHDADVFNSMTSSNYYNKSGNINYSQIAIDNNLTRYKAEKVIIPKLNDEFKTFAMSKGVGV